MKITEVRFKHISKERKGDTDVLSVCSVQLDYTLIVHGVKIVQVADQIKVFLPERKVGRDGDYKPVVVFSNPEFQENFYQEVIRHYFKDISENQE